MWGRWALRGPEVWRHWKVKGRELIPTVISKCHPVPSTLQSARKTTVNGLGPHSQYREEAKKTATICLGQKTQGIGASGDGARMRAVQGRRAGREGRADARLQ